jgi:Tol biopolymer transport system component
MVMLKSLKVTVIAVIMLALLLGCSNQQPGASAPSQTAAGGISQPGQNINLKDVNIATDGGKTIITLSMLSGSRKAGYPESKLTRLPEYEISQLMQPQRLMIKLSSISFWDYEANSDKGVSDIVLGIFQEVPANDNTLILYVQLSRAVEFDVEESEGNLILKLTPGAENTEAKYFCLSDSFYEHQEGTWPDNINMTPVLCSDLKNKLLISEPFDTEQAANEFRNAANEMLKTVLPGNTVYAAQLAKDALPEYLSEADYSAAEGRSVVMKDGVLMDTPLLLQNGKYLAAAGDGRIAFSRMYTPEAPDIFPLSEKLWILDPNGRIQSIDVSDFYAIDEAAFSPDGSYIAILDVSIENRVLYVYDFTAGRLINLGEEGFGSDTAAFTWSDTSDTLYAMTGHGTMQMMSCTFSQDGTFSITAVEERAGSEGALGVSYGRLFFAENAGTSGRIYEIGAVRREITSGIDFTIAPDGKKLLVLETSASDSEEVLTSLKLCDIETGESTYIAQNADITGFGFSQNGSKVYYMDASVAAAGEYKYGLFSYDVVSAGSAAQAALCSTYDFATVPSSGQIYLIQYIGSGRNSFYATYTYDLNE